MFKKGVRLGGSCQLTLCVHFHCIVKTPSNLNAVRLLNVEECNISYLSFDVIQV